MATAEGGLSIMGTGPEDLRFPPEWLHGRIMLEDGRSIGITGWTPSMCIDDMVRVTIEGVLFPADKEPDGGYLITGTNIGVQDVVPPPPPPPPVPPRREIPANERIFESEAEPRA